MTDSRNGRILVLGGGGAGMMAAISAARHGAKVVLLEKTQRLGYKIHISGKGRCNLTNAETNLKEWVEHYPGGGKFLWGPLTQFGPQDTIRLFQELGVPTQRDRGGRIFPESDSSDDVVEALKNELRRLGVEVRLDAQGKSIVREEGSVTGLELKSGEMLEADALIVAVGGQSFPGTGSTGDGYPMARSVGHHVVEPFPALVPLKVNGAKELDGLELRNVKATVLADGKSLLSRQGELRFAHFGLTGPIVLYLSRHAVLAQKQGKKVDIQLNLKPALSREQLDAGLRRDWEQAPRASVSLALKERLPERLIPAFLLAAGVDGAKRVSEVSRQERNRMLDTFLSWSFPLVCPLSREVAEVTAGGVDLKEIDPKTMASKLVSGLFWAGEVIDVDGYIGGYNLQAAWSTGWVAGVQAARHVMASCLQEG